MMEEINNTNIPANEYLKGTTNPPIQQNYGTSTYPMNPAFNTVNTNYFPPLAIKVKKSEPFNKADGDTTLFIISYLIGLLYINWLFLSATGGWAFTAFTVICVLTVMLYGKKLNAKPTKESFFWLAILLITGISYSLTITEGSLSGWRTLLLFTSYFYWCQTYFDCQINKKTSEYIFFDTINILFIIPFKNFFLGFKTIPSLKKLDKTKKSKYINIIIGIIIFIPIFILLVPLLVSADGGMFQDIIYKLDEITYNIFNADFILKALFAIPISLYISGKLIGLAHKRGTTAFTTTSLKKNGEIFKIIPEASIQTILFLTTLLYSIFIGCQIPYFFSAFFGKVPNGYVSYSEFARKGFFELCAIAVINIGLILLLHFLAKDKQSKIRKINVCLLCGVTILLIITAFQKMMIYISAYGLTSKRIVTSVFMFFLAILFIGIILHNIKKFDIVRYSVILGTIILCLLSIINLDDIIIIYNFNAYINQEIEDFDSALIQKSSNLSINMLVNKYDKIQNYYDKLQVKEELEYRYYHAQANENTISDTLMYSMIRNNQELKNLIEIK